MGVQFGQGPFPILILDFGRIWHCIEAPVQLPLPCVPTDSCCPGVSYLNRSGTFERGFPCCSGFFAPIQLFWVRFFLPSPQSWTVSTPGICDGKQGSVGVKWNDDIFCLSGDDWQHAFLCRISQLYVVTP